MGLPKSISDRTGLIATASVYVTPAYVDRLNPHTDDENILVVQTYGAKEWRFGFPLTNRQVSPHTLSDNEFTAPQHCILRSLFSCWENTATLPAKSLPRKNKKTRLVVYLIRVCSITRYSIDPALPMTYALTHENPLLTLANIITALSIPQEDQRIPY